MFNFPSMLLQRRPYSEVERRARLGFMEDPYDPEAVLPGSNNPNMNASGLLDSFNPNPFADMAPGGTSRGSFPALESLPPRSLWGGERSSFGGESPEYMNKRNPELYDLMAGSLLGADPQQGISPWIQNALDKSKPFTPSSIAPSDTVIPSMRTGGLLESLKSARQDLPMPNGVSYRDAMGMAIPVVGDVASPDVNPLLEGVLQSPKTVQRTFGGSSGETVYDMTPDYGSYTGSGSFRGIRFNNKDEEQAAMDKWHAAQGLRETGVAGSRSLEQIMSEQLKGQIFPGLDGGQTAKRQAALGIQQGMMNPLAALERDRIQGDTDIRRAELMQKDNVSNKLLEMAGYNAQRIREGGGTEEEATNAFNSTLRQAGAALPGTVRDRLGAPVTSPLNAGSLADQSRAKSVLDIIRRGEYNRGSAQTVMDRFAEATPEQQNALIEQIRTMGRSPEAAGTMADFGEQMAKALAFEGTRLGMGSEGLPFEMPDSSTIVLPGGRRIALGYKDRPNIFQGPSALNRMTPQIEAEMKRRAAAKRLSELIYGSQK